MKELLERVIGVIPAYVSDFLSFISGPKKFILDRLDQDESAMQNALVFFGVSFAISWIIKAPLMRSVSPLDPLSQFGTEAAFVFICAGAYGGAIYVAWRLVGGKAGLSRFFVIHFHFAGVLLIIMAGTFLATMGIIRAGDAHLYKEMFDAAEGGRMYSFVLENAEALMAHRPFLISLIVFYVGCAGGLLWIFTGWGAYRKLNQMTKLQSALAGVLFMAFSILVAIVTFFIANALVGK